MSIEKAKQKNKLKGFSLIESLIATFIFVMITIMVMETFFSVIESRKRVRMIQQDIEDARYAMEIMAKSLRMSSVFSSDGTQGNIDFYDYSQKKCFRYRIADNKVKVQTAGSTEDSTYRFVTGCESIWTGESDVTNGNVRELSFNVEKSVKGSGGVPNKLGHVTISMKICYENECDNNDSALIQSSVSLRDYGFIKDY
jgi:Tfp pilus assembly protein PilW